MTFHYDDHKRVKDLRPVIKGLVNVIKTHTEEAKLSHFDANKFLNMSDVNFNEL